MWHRHQRDAAAVRRVVFGYGVGVSAMMWKRFREDGDRRAVVTLLRWLAGPAVKAAWSRARGRPGAPADLLLAEAWGFLHGPFRLSRPDLPLAEGRRRG